MKQFLKKGLVYPPGKYDWAQTHCQNPFAVQIDKNIFRVYFASRDKDNQARGGIVDIDFQNDCSIIKEYQNPILSLGRLGCFDDCGTMPSTIVKEGNTWYMYYTGWSKAVKTPFTFYIGLALSHDGGLSFERYSEAPVLGRTMHDPLLAASPWVIKEGGVWRMWYVSATSWEHEGSSNKRKHYYHIRYAQSINGLDWITNGTVCIDFRDDEYAIARPVVLQENGVYKMWFCFRGGNSTYRMGYAESTDGIVWNRIEADDSTSVPVSASGWDSEMICYPFVFDHNGKRMMLYNGNGYGQTGFGLAVLEDIPDK